MLNSKWLLSNIEAKMDSDIQGILILQALAGLCWLTYNKTLRKKHGDLIGNKIPEIDMPGILKCNVLEFDQCEKSVLDGWSLCHFIVHAITGFLFPGKTFFIFIIAIMTELFEQIIGFRAKYILDPITNVVSYGIGTLLKNLLL
jgi:hypothetical protein